MYELLFLSYSLTFFPISPIASLPCYKEWETNLELAKTLAVILEEFKNIHFSSQDSELALIPKSFSKTNLGKLFFDAYVC